MTRLTTVIGITGSLLAFSSTTLGSDRQEEGRQAYEKNCATCHETGTNGAPSTHNTTDWSGRSNLWEAVQMEHANKGYMKMPAKGGHEDLSEYDVDVAAEYMLNITHPDEPRD